MMAVNGELLCSVLGPRLLTASCSCGGSKHAAVVVRGGGGGGDFLSSRSF